MLGFVPAGLGRARGTRIVLSAGLSSPAVARNRDPILSVLRRVLPRSGTVLEIASGTGEHAVHFAAAFPGLAWQPTDIDAGALASIAAHREAAALANLQAPIRLDVRERPWPIGSADAVVSINMIHIAPWEAAEALIGEAGRLLPAGGVLFLYGPFIESDRELAPSNASFDASLRARDPAWGLRRLDDVIGLARDAGLAFQDRVEMPANNLSIVFARDGGSGSRP